MTRVFGRGFGLLVGLSVALITSLAGSARAQSCEPQVARAVSVQGTVEARRAQAASWQPVKLNDTFCPGDTIQVQERSRADVAMLDQSVLRLNAGATITVEAVKDQRTAVVGLLQGAAHFFSRGPRSLDVRTPFTTAGVRGTEFLVSVEQDRTLLTIFEGTVSADNPAGSLVLASGQSAVAERGKAPVMRVVARPRDAVQWALYYPPVVYFRPDEFPAGTGLAGSGSGFPRGFHEGRSPEGLRQHPECPRDVPDPRFFAYRASLLLAVGRVDEARADIQRALRLRANDPNALALQTIIAVVQNEQGPGAPGRPAGRPGEPRVWHGPRSPCPTPSRLSSISKARARASRRRSSESRRTRWRGPGWPSSTPRSASSARRSARPRRPSPSSPTSRAPRPCWATPI